MMKIGHRGASGILPENTLAAFRKALALGADGLECDVHLCKSGEAVVIHDETLQRTTNGKGRVSDHTLDQLHKLDAGNGERIPTLEELIADIDGSATIFIEVKAAAAGEAVAAIVDAYAKKSHIGHAKLPVISFNFDLVAGLKQRHPHLLLGATPPERKIPADFIDRAYAAGMWSANPCIKILDQRFVDDAHARGLKVFTWTANSAKDIAKAKKLDVDGIISDFPDRIPV